MISIRRLAWLYALTLFGLTFVALGGGALQQHTPRPILHPSNEDRVHQPNPETENQPTHQNNILQAQPQKDQKPPSAQNQIRDNGLQILNYLTFGVLVVYGVIAYLMYKTLIVTDRPYLTVDHVIPYECKAPHTENNDTDRWQLAVRVSFTNSGKSPARLSHLIVIVMMNYLAQLEDREAPHYHADEIGEIASSVIAEGKSRDWEHSGERLSMSWEDMDRYTPNDDPHWDPAVHRNLFFVGFVRYEDTHGKSHESHFAFRYIDTPQPPRVAVVQNRRFWKYT